MKTTFDTTTERRGRPSSRILALAVAGLGVVLLAVGLWPDNFSPGEDLISPGARDIAVSREDSAYPGSDALRLDGSPEAVYVYVRVEDLPEGDFGARVGWTARDSVVGRLAGDGGLRIADRGEGPLGASGGGLSGVLKFAVRQDSGDPLPSGNYTVEVYGGAGSGEVLARKYFVVGD